MGNRPFSSLEGALLPRSKGRGHAPLSWAVRGGPPGSPPPKTLPTPALPPAHSRTSLEPVPYTAKRGEGQGPTNTAALRHEPPSPARDPGQGRGAHFLYLAGLDPILSRGGLQSPHLHPIHLPGSVGSGLGSPFLCSPLLSLFHPLSSLSYVSVPSYLSLFSLLHRLFLCPLIFCPVSMSLPMTYPHYTFSRAGPTGRTRLSPCLPPTPNKSPHEQSPKQSPPPYRSQDPPPQQN